MHVHCFLIKILHVATVSYTVIGKLHNEFHKIGLPVCVAIEATCRYESRYAICDVMPHDSFI